MNASILGLNNYLISHKKSSGYLEHKDKQLTRNQAIAIVQFGLRSGRKTTDDITDDELEMILKHFT